MDLHDPMYPDASTELHVAHHANGNVKDDAQWYNIYEHPTEAQLELARKALNIDEDDWKVVEHLLGSFRHVIYKHTSPSEIRVDEEIIRGGEWTTQYF
jgi:hypothetical protein